MQADSAVRLPADDATLDALGDDAMEVLVREARAGVAQLTLQLRAFQRDARPADADVDVERPSIEFDKARELLTSSLDQRFAARRRAMLEEEAAVRVEAAQRIRAAHEEGAALIAEANAGCMAVLVGGLRSPGEAGPDLRIVAEPVPPAGSEASAPALGTDTPSPAQAAIGTRAPSPVPAHPARGTPSPSHPATGTHAPAADHAATGTHAPAAVEPPVAPATAEGRPAAVPPSPAPSTRARSWSGLKSYLYLDVMLPLLAVLVVLAVLLAWVG